MSNVITKSVLVLASIGNIQPAYEPANQFRVKGIEAKYIDSRGYSAAKSEARKKELWDNISRIRKEMAKVVMSVKQIDANTTARADSNKARMALKTLENTGKFVDNIFQAPVKTKYNQIHHNQMN
jgi:hypothetical protein